MRKGKECRNFIYDNYLVRKITDFDKRNLDVRKIKRIGMLIGASLMVLVFAACTNNWDSVTCITDAKLENKGKESEEMSKEVIESNAAEEASGLHVEMETELESMTDYYEPTEISQLDYDSFRSRMSDEDWEGFQQYFPILKENVSFQFADFEYLTELNKDGEVAKEGESVIFYRYISKEVTDINSFVKGYADDGIEEMMIREVRVFDLDGDGVKELILEWTPAGDFLILHCENEEFYGWHIMYRGFEALQTNGIFISSGGAASNRWQSICFDNGSWLVENLLEEDWGKYYLNGEPADEDAFWQKADAYMTGDVIGYEPKRRTESDIILEH